MKLLKHQDHSTVVQHFVIEMNLENSIVEELELILLNVDMGDRKKILFEDLLIVDVLKEVHFRIDAVETAKGEYEILQTIMKILLQLNH